MTQKLGMTRATGTIVETSGKPKVLSCRQKEGDVKDMGSNIAPKCETHDSRRWKRNKKTMYDLNYACV